MTEAVCPSCGYGQSLDGLRAQIDVLRAANRTRDWDYHSALDDVLDILDGGSE